MTSKTPKQKASYWYKEAIIYQLHVRSFYDSNNDGIGDFRGLTSKLDYLSDLGVTAIWLLPFYPSPLRDDGYDIADYTQINKSYGTIEDFREFLDEAHKRNLRVITELVINHTSDQHEWFQKSRHAKPGEPYYDYYVWSKTARTYKDARIIFKDFETSNWSWDPIAKRYFWHRFYSHQPDLNFDNPQVRKEVKKLLDYWLGMGVDGLRLDAIPYLIEREGTSCENLSETHDVLKDLRKHVDKKFPDAAFLAEANQWPEDAIAYFGDGDECHMAFHFPLMPRMFMAVKMEDHFTIADILRQTPAIPESCQWATFLRNHDELTLEMVTDEERDYMYKAYALDPRARINLGIRRRLAPLLGNDRRQTKLLNAMLFSITGVPIIYYGDEIGMGDNIYLGDRDGVRTPFQWNPDRNAGFSKASPQRLFLPVITEPEYHYETINVETQQANTNSLLWWMKQLIALRKAYPALNHGALRILPSKNSKTLIYLRETNEQTILMVSNLSRNAQYAEIDLQEFKGRYPFELFGRNQFPPIGDLPYFITLGPYSFYWFELKEAADFTGQLEEAKAHKPMTISIDATDITEVLNDKTVQRLESYLVKYLPHQRWFTSKSQTIMECKITGLDFISESTTKESGDTFALAFVTVSYSEGLPESYFLPIALVEARSYPDIIEHAPAAIIAQLSSKESTDPAYLIDAAIHPKFGQTIVKFCCNKRQKKGQRFSLKAHTHSKVKEEWKTDVAEPQYRSFEQSNSLMVFGQELILKLFRKLEEGVNADLEIGTFLRAQGFTDCPNVIGSIELIRGNNSYTLGLVQEFVENEGDAWNLAVDNFSKIAEQSLGTPAPRLALSAAEANPFDLFGRRPGRYLMGHMGYYYETAAILGEKTAAMHKALASSRQNKDFAPEAFTPFYQRSLYQSFRNSLTRTFDLIEDQMRGLSKENKALAKKILESEEQLLKKVAFLKTEKIKGKRIRHHGDYHLGQVLFLGNDFLILDFEGEPSRTLSERKIKVSALRDVAGIIRSYDYAVYYTLRQRIIRDEDRTAVAPVLHACNRWLTAKFLNSYLSKVKDAKILPTETEQIKKLLDIFMIEKVLYEIRYEINSRPDWVDIPFQGLLSLLTESKGKAPKKKAKAAGSKRGKRGKS